MHTIRFDSGEGDELQVTDYIGSFHGSVPRENEAIIFAGTKYYVNMVVWHVEEHTLVQPLGSSRATVYVRSA